VLAAVGPLQFEVVADRMQHDFRSPVTLEPLGYSIARRTDPAGAEALVGQSEVEVLRRRSDGVLLAVFSTKWRLETVRRKLPDVTLEPLPAGTAVR
jgi:peptide chain release factor 3